MTQSTIINQVYTSIEHYLESIRQMQAVKTLSSLDRVFSPSEKIDGTTQHLPHQKLLFGASVLARSQNRRHLIAALIIAEYYLNHDDELFKSAGAILFEQLDNGRSLQLAETKGLLKNNWTNALSLDLRLQSAVRGINMSVPYHGATIDSLNRFQRELWDQLDNHKACVSVSAPTASGKSFIIHKWLAKQLRTIGRGLYIYVAPTNALCDEVARKLREEVELSRNFTTFVSTSKRYLGNATPTKDYGVFVHVVTQEGAAGLLHTIPAGVQLHSLIVDEAYKIEDGHRGIVLESVIVDYRERWPEHLAIFLSPGLENPEIFELITELDPLSKQEKYSNTFEQSLVRQQFFLIEPIRRNTSAWKISSLSANDSAELGTLKIPRKGRAQDAHVATICAALRPIGSTLIYAKSPGEVYKIADEVKKRMDLEQRTDTVEELKELANYIRQQIHNKYNLAAYIECGIGLHYGNLPLLIRRRIEALFAQQHLSFLLSTSTLMEGVNIYCDNIVLTDFKKGRANFTSRDFWNLAGRAGRWGHSFEGNVFLITNEFSQEKTPIPDYQKFIHSPLQPAKSAFRSSLSDLEINELLDPKTVRRATIESSEIRQASASYLISRRLTDRPERFSRLLQTSELESIRVNTLDSFTRTVKTENRLPIQITRANRTINPLLLTNLYDDLKQKDVTELKGKIPRLESYPDILNTLTYLTEILVLEYKERQLTYFAQIFCQWHQKMPLGEIIAKRLAFLGKEENESSDVSKTINELLESLKTHVEYKIPKYIYAYLDVLEHVLQEKGATPPELERLKDTLQGFDPDEPVSFLTNIGLSREAAVLLTTLIPKTNTSTLLEQLKKPYIREHIEKLPSFLRDDIEMNLAPLLRENEELI